MYGFVYVITCQLPNFVLAKCEILYKLRCCNYIWRVFWWYRDFIMVLMDYLSMDYYWSMESTYFRIIFGYCLFNCWSSC